VTAPRQLAQHMCTHGSPYPEGCEHSPQSMSKTIRFFFAVACAWCIWRVDAGAPMSQMMSNSIEIVGSPVTLITRRIDIDRCIAVPAVLVYCTTQGSNHQNRLQNEAERAVDTGAALGDPGGRGLHAFEHPAHPPSKGISLVPVQSMPGRGFTSHYCGTHLGTAAQSDAVAFSVVSSSRAGTRALRSPLQHDGLTMCSTPARHA